MDVGFGWVSIVPFIPRHRTHLSVGSSVASCSVCHHAIRSGPARFGPPSPAPMRCACGVCLCVPPCPPACYCSCKPSTLVSVPVVSCASSHCSSVSAPCSSAVSSLPPRLPRLLPLRLYVYAHSPPRTPRFQLLEKRFPDRSLFLVLASSRKRQPEANRQPGMSAEQTASPLPWPHTRYSNTITPNLDIPPGPGRAGGCERYCPTLGEPHGACLPRGGTRACGEAA